MRFRNPLAMSAYFHGYRYAMKSADNRFPVIKGPLPTSLLWIPAQGYGARLIDCSTFIMALAIYCHPDVAWDDKAYPDGQIMNSARLWSPVDMWIRHGLGRRINEGEAPASGWGFYQSWVDDKPADIDGDPISGGHQWAYHAKKKLRLHSTIRGERGVILERGVKFSDLEKYYKDGIQGVELGKTA